MTHANLSDFDLENDWLEERCRFDARARNAPVEKRILEFFSSVPLIRVLDIGSGLGANVRYYSRLFDCDQKWFLVEKSPERSLKAPGAIKSWAKENGWKTNESEKGITVLMPHRRVQIEFKHGSFLDRENMALLSGIDLVAANALLDLITEKQFEDLAGGLAVYRIPLLATLNYESMSFSPCERKDTEFIAAYEGHMKRHRQSGRAMGPDAVRHVTGFSEKNGVSVLSGKSPWHIGGKDQKMATLLFFFIERALAEVRASGKWLSGMNSWIRRKRRKIWKGDLETTVTHSDVFMNFDGVSGGVFQPR